MPEERIIQSDQRTAHSVMTMQYETYMVKSAGHGMRLSPCACRCLTLLLALD